MTWYVVAAGVFALSAVIGVLAVRLLLHTLGDEWRGR